MCSDTFSCQRWIWLAGTSDLNSPGLYDAELQANPSDAPSARVGGTGWQIDGNLFLFGGNATNSQYNNDLWKYNISDGIWACLVGPSDSQSLSRRMSSTGWSFGTNLFLFGGFNNHGYLNDLWTFDSVTHQLIKLSGSDGYNQSGNYGVKGISNKNNYPGARASSTSWKIGSDFFLFGGFGKATSDAGTLNDLWHYNPSDQVWTWVSGENQANPLGSYGAQNIANDTNLPGGRSGALGWMVGKDLFLFGGAGSSATLTNQILNDLWKFNTTTKQWTWISGDTTGQAHYGTLGIASSDNQPGGRSAAYGWRIDHKLFLFGGKGYAETYSGQLNDLWQFDLQTGLWTWISGSKNVNSTGRYYSEKGKLSALNQPSARFGGVSFIVGSDRFLFGGSQDAFGTKLKNDLWQVVRFCPCPLTVDNDIQSNATGFGRADGSVSVVASGGKPPYSYLWSTGEHTNALSGLQASDYTIVVTDTNSDVAQLIVSILEPPQLMVRANTVGSDGATATVSGGLPPYAYLWDNGDTSIDTQNLLRGLHRIIARDANSDFASDLITVSGAMCDQSDLFKTVDLSHILLKNTLGDSDNTFCINTPYFSSFYVSVAQGVELATVCIYENELIIYISDMVPGPHLIPLVTAKTPGTYHLKFTATDFSDLCTVTISDLSSIVTDYPVQLSDVMITIVSGGINISGATISSNNPTTRIVNIYNDDILSHSQQLMSDTYFSDKLSTIESGILGVITLEAYDSDHPSCSMKRKFQKNNQIFLTLTGARLSFTLTSALLKNTVSDEGSAIFSSVCQSVQEISNHPFLATLLITSLSDLWSSDALLSQGNNTNVFISCSDSTLCMQEVNNQFKFCINFSDMSDLVISYSDGITLFSDHHMTSQSIILNQIYGPPQIAVSNISANSDRNIICANQPFSLSFDVASSMPSDMNASIVWDSRLYQTTITQGTNFFQLPAPDVNLPSDCNLDITVNFANIPNVSHTESIIVEVLPAAVVTLYSSDTVLPNIPEAALWSINRAGAQPSDLFEVILTDLSNGYIHVSDVISGSQGVFIFTVSDCSAGGVELKVQDLQTGCLQQKNLIISFRPSVDAGSDITIPCGSSTVIGVGPALSDMLYTWFPSDGISDVHAFPTTVMPISDITYTVTARRTNISDCIASDSVHISLCSLRLSNVQARPACINGQLTVLFDLEGNGANITLSLNGSDHTSAFVPGTGLFFNLQAPALASDYICTLIAIDPTYTCANNQQQIIVTVKAPVSVDAGSDITIPQGSSTIIGVGPALSDVEYTWVPAIGISDIHSFPAQVRLISDTTYTVFARRTDISDCMRADSVTISSANPDRTILRFDLIGSMLQIDLSVPLELVTRLIDVNDFYTIFNIICAYSATQPCREFTAGLIKPVQSDVFSNLATILEKDHMVILRCSDARFYITEHQQKFVLSLTPTGSDDLTIDYTDANQTIQKIMSPLNANLHVLNDDHFKWITPCASDSLGTTTTILNDPLLFMIDNGTVTDIQQINANSLCHSITSDISYVCQIKTNILNIGHFLDENFSDYASHVSGQAHLLYEGGIRAERVRIDWDREELVFYGMSIQACSDN